ncbi:MAG: thioesterase family protein [Candidatus Auribacterota bacterium]|jgi:acyl-CoA thioester hydrolase|nr:thioesterase family protein [Candidatus Auribacterota bacterium]
MTQEHTTTLRVRYAEVDQMGFVHHSRYLAYFEIARTEYLRESGYTYREFEQLGLYLVVAKVFCKYKYPIRYDEVIHIKTQVTGISPAKIEHAYEIWNETNTVLHAQAQTTLACVDTQGHIQRIPDFLQNLVEDGASGLNEQ